MTCALLTTGSAGSRTAASLAVQARSGGCSTRATGTQVRPRQASSATRCRGAAGSEGYESVPVQCTRHCGMAAAVRAAPAHQAAGAPAERLGGWWCVGRRHAPLPALQEHRWPSKPPAYPILPLSRAHAQARRWPSSSSSWGRASTPSMWSASCSTTACWRTRTSWRSRRCLSPRTGWPS